MENLVKEARALGYRGWRMLRKHGAEGLQAGIVAVKKRRAGETLSEEEQGDLQKMVDADYE